MIVSTAALPEYRGRLRWSTGGFDPLHAGHIGYFQATAELGVPVLVVYLETVTLSSSAILARFAG